jgi:hypothetical protein
MLYSQIDLRESVWSYRLTSRALSYALSLDRRDSCEATPAPDWIVEIGLTENFDGGINPDFEAIFNQFWSRRYQAHAVEANCSIGPDDIAHWIEDRDRGFWNINYLFTR